MRLVPTAGYVAPVQIVRGARQSVGGRRLKGGAEGTAGAQLDTGSLRTVRREAQPVGDKFRQQHHRIERIVEIRADSSPVIAVSLEPPMRGIRTFVCDPGDHVFCACCGVGYGLAFFRTPFPDTLSLGEMTP